MAMKRKSVKVRLKFPLLGSVEGTWEVDEDQQRAAWEMHVELVTRIAIVGLRPDEGILREALSSHYSLFESTREILRRYGPTLAKQRGGNISFGYLAVAVLNTVLRPLLAKWHPELASYEAARPATVSVAEHERSWPAAVELRDAIEKTRGILVEYADLLAEVAGVPSLIIPAEARSARDE